MGNNFTMELLIHDFNKIHKALNLSGDRMTFTYEHCPVSEFRTVLIINNDYFPEQH
jgi:hypothetical protein